MSTVDLYDNNITLKSSENSKSETFDTNNIGFYVIVTKPNKHKISTKVINDTGKDLEEVKNKIIYVIQEEISKLKFNCEFPDSYEKFINTIWYNEISADAEPFEYKIFDHNTWVAPWEPEDLFDEAVEILHKIDILNAIIVEANKDEEEFEDHVDEELLDTTKPMKSAFEELKEFFAEDD